jgi:hypothetical protein
MYRPDTTRELIIHRPQHPSQGSTTKMRTSTTHLGGHLDRTTLIFTLVGIALLGLLALI